jgi:hypothetical protein
MVLAGSGALPYFSQEMLDSHSAESLVSEVYRAMRMALEAKPSPHHQVQI